MRTEIERVIIESASNLKKEITAKEEQFKG